MQVQVSGIYIQTGTYTYIHVHRSAAADLCPWGSPSSSCITTHTLHIQLTSLTLNCVCIHLCDILSLPLLLWIFLCLPEIFSWPQSTAFCARLLLLISGHGTTCKRKRGWCTRVYNDIYLHNNTCQHRWITTLHLCRPYQSQLWICNVVKQKQQKTRLRLGKVSKHTSHICVNKKDPLVWS